MTKNQKILIGVGVVALAYYFYTKSKSNDKNFSNFSSGMPCSRRVCPPQFPYCEEFQGRSICRATPRKRQSFQNPILINP
jgi:hypothetical protein